jgi:hypothetical protein
MKTLRRSAGAVITTWGVGLVAAGIAAAPATAAPGNRPDATSATTDGTVEICHATNSVQNPYSLLEVSIDSLDGLGNGNADHFAHVGPVWTAAMAQGDVWGDIIPPIPGVLPAGMNWTDDGAAIHGADCAAAAQATTTTTAAPTTTTTVAPTTTTTVAPTTTTTVADLTTVSAPAPTTTAPDATTTTTAAPTEGVAPAAGVPAAAPDALPTEVEGVQVVRQPAALARTGSPTQVLLLVAGLLLTVGGLLVAGSTMAAPARRP